MQINYCFSIYEFNEAITPYSTLEIIPPDESSFILDDFRSGTHFRTKSEEETNRLTLDLEKRLLTIILDESGSMTWNDQLGDRYVYIKRLLRKLKYTYPGEITTNLIGFGGIPVKSYLMVVQSQVDFVSPDNQSNIEDLLSQTFQDSTYDFAGVRVVRRTDRYPEHAADGIIVTEGIFDAVKDTNLIEGTKYYYGVWSFNKDLHFSTGKFISGTPRDRDLPNGVNFVSALSRILPGCSRDEYTQIIYNFAERSGVTIFDSSGKGNHGILGSEVIEENFWSGDSTISQFNIENDPVNPIGARFDGSFDIIETSVNNNFNFNGISSSNTQDIFVSFWIYRYETSQDTWIVGTSLSTESNTIGWSIGIDSSGNVGYAFNDISSGFTSIPNTSIPIQTWTMISVQMSSLGEISVYINGIISNTISISNSINTSGMEKLYIGAKPVTSIITWSGVDFFGILSQISLSNTIRNSDYVYDLFKQETQIFNQLVQDSVFIPPDNKQREVLLQWNIEENFNYSGGKVRIVRKYRHIPSHEEDGDLVTEQEASEGQFFFIDSYDFIHNSDYYYRVFTVNSIGNTCSLSDARSMFVHIQKSIINYSQTVVANVEEASIFVGNKKIMLQWSNPDINSGWIGTKIFFSPERYPTISFSSQGDLEVSDGHEICDTRLEFFVHRKLGISPEGTIIPLENGKFHYYTIICYDVYGNISSPVLISGVPLSSSNAVFPPAEIENLHITLLNPKTLSVQWENPTLRTDKLDLFFGESALIFVNIRDIFGGVLDDILDMNIQVCTSFIEREITTSETPLGLNGPGESIQNPCGSVGIVLINGGCGHGSSFDEDCNNEREKAETVLTYSSVQSGLIKGLLTHTTERSVLARRQRYDMDVRAQYKILDTETNQLLFEFNTIPTRVSFKHPLNISLINKLNKKVTIPCDSEEGIRGEQACVSSSNCDGSPNLSTPCLESSVNGCFVNSSSPYVCRIEIQYKDESLPNGTPVNVSMFKHSSDFSFTEKSNRTFITEGMYETVAVIENQIDSNGNSTSQTFSKSIVDIEIPPPSQSDYVDLYVSIDYLGFFVDAVHEIRFISNVNIELNTRKPIANGIDVAEQFANVWTSDPDNPENRLPVPDGTLVKWELLKLRFGKDRPFYSIEQLGQPIAGVYSRTSNGIARNVFFGPVGNITSHLMPLCEGQDSCCIGEEYAIKASVIFDDQSSSDAQYAVFDCIEEDIEFQNKRFLMNAAPNQPGQSPNYITWADGEHLLHFQIAKNPSISTIQGAECFRRCVESEISGQLFSFPSQHIVEINAYAEILWNVIFAEDPYTAQITPISYESSRPEIVNGNLTPAIAGIPITSETTDFYLRINNFIGDNNPKPQECSGSSANSGSIGLGSDGNVILPCEWENVCHNSSDCSNTKGIRWMNVSSVSGRSTIIADNIPVTLFGGGDYDNGIPPILVGFKEPLDVRIIEARVNGQRLSALQELVVDGISQHTFVVEVLFANNPVPDGTPVEISVTGENANVVNLSNCSYGIPGCSPVVNNKIYTRLTNDIYINPDGEKRSLCYFSIDPLQNVQFNAKINVTCRYDKLGTISREITKCVQLLNIVNDIPTINDPSISLDETVSSTSVSSNEMIVFDTIQNNFERFVSNTINRIGHFSEVVTHGTDDHIYALGGFTEHDLNGAKGITATSEVFTRSINSWDFISDMPTPRACGMSVTDGNNIYCIGGLELDSETQKYNVSRKIESLNKSNHIWNESLSPMPENYGVAFGSSFLVNGYIYVICGVTSVINNSQPEVLNDRILRYSIDDDEWIVIVPSVDTSYMRISPFSFYRSNPQSSGSTESDKQIYAYGGSVKKNISQIQAEFTTELNRRLNDFRSFILTSSYFLSLSEQEQISFLQREETRIRQEIHIPAYIYISNGFRFNPGSEQEISGVWTIEVFDRIDTEWPVLPMTRDRGSCIYIPYQDVAYFIGGSNQNQSTTLNRIESINLKQSNNYYRHSSLSRGRCLFSSVYIGDDIYICGGMTSGHKEGYVDIEVLQYPNIIESLGSESSGIIIVLKNDSGEIIEDEIKCIVRGRIKIPEIDDSVIDFIANRTANRILGGNGSSPISVPDTFDPALVRLAQNSVVDPNSDEFQFNASKKLNEQLFLFPIIYSKQEFTISTGIGGTTLLPRSEDPLADFNKLSEFIKQSTMVPEQTSSPFVLPRDEVIALGEVLDTIQLPPVVLNTNTIRNLYSIETTVTILDDFYFGQSISTFDTELQQRISEQIVTILTPPTTGEGDDEEDNNEGLLPSNFLGTSSDDECFLLQHVSSNQIPSSNTPASDSGATEPNGIGGFAESGQCTYCYSLLPVNPGIRTQNNSSECLFYNKTDWLPQIKKRLTNGDHTIDECLDEIDTIDHEIPFGSSQLFNAMVEASRITSIDSFDNIKKSFYILSDNSQNMSIIPRQDAIDAINSVDGLHKSPVVYIVLSTSFPSTISSQFEQTEIGDVEKIVQQTGGRSSVLRSSLFMNEVLNLTTGQATGGLGWGKHIRKIDLPSLSNISEMISMFELPQNTNGFIRFRTSQDGYNFNDFTEKFEGTQLVSFSNLFAKIIEVESILTTGFSVDISEEYDIIPTQLPKLISLSFKISPEKEDFIFLDHETVNSNVQQVAASACAVFSNNMNIDIGVSTSISHNWEDYQNQARPSIKEYGKTLLLQRDNPVFSIVPMERLYTRDGLKFKSSYGSWDPYSVVKLYSLQSDGTEVPILSGFKTYSRKGEIYFEKRRPLNEVIKIEIVNSNILRVGLKISNRLHDSPVILSGVGYMYTTNNIRPPELSQIGPRVINVMISPSNPNTGDTIFALYQYIDPNNDPETGSLISWFKNDSILHEIQNKTSWSNNDLSFINKVIPNDRVYFSITPSDGVDYGPSVISPTVTIAARPPIINNLSLIALRNGIVQERFETSSTFRVEYDFESPDSGLNSQESNTVIKWIVNGSLFKIGTYPTDSSVNPKELSPTELSQGVSAHIIGNLISCEVQPQTSLISGQTISTSTITVVNTIPRVTNAVISPSNPSRQSTLQISYTIDDPDITSQSGSQQDQSEIRWYVSTNNQDFTEISELRDVNSVPSVYLELGQYWKAQVTGYDGLDLGTPVFSNTVLISN